MKKAVIYIHGKGGSPLEAEHYRPLFPDADVLGLAYTAENPWDAVREFVPYFETLRRKYSRIQIVANSIGAYFALHALEGQVDRAWLISPIVDMERLILDMLDAANCSEEELCRNGTVKTAFGETLSWDYLTYVRQHPIRWSVPTNILYGSKDHMTGAETVEAFARKVGAELTVLPGGEHWFHTEEQMAFLDRWIRGSAMELSIDRARPEDAEELLAYLRDIGGESDNLSFGAEGLPFSVEAEQSYICSMENTGVMLVVRQNGRIVANGSFTLERRERFCHRGELAVSVRKCAWGQGIGTRLVKALLDFAKNEAHAEIVTLEVRSDNARAIRLYEKFGFVKIGVFPGFMKVRGERVSADLMNLYMEN